MAHSSIECALRVGRTKAPLVIRVHPRARQAAPHDEVADGLQAKFSIPYLTAFTLLRGAPDVGSFATVDAAAGEHASVRLRLVEDAGLGESEARLERPGGEPLATVEYALGSPRRPLDAEGLQAKVRALGGPAALPDGPAADLLAELGRCST